MSSSVSSPPSRLINDELWALVEPLIPPQKPAVHGRTGRPRTADRDVLEGIAFVLSALRYDRSATTITALVRLAVTLICARRLLGN